MNATESQALDRHITGNWGEDYFDGQDDDCAVCQDDNLADDQRWACVYDGDKSMCDADTAADAAEALEDR